MARYHRKEKKLDVLLINAPILFKKTRRSRGGDKWYPPLGPMYIAASLRQDGFKVKFLDVRADMGLADVIKFIAREQPRIIGISSLTSGIASAVKMAKTIKKKHGDEIHICLGGSHVSADPGVIERFPFFDTAVTQEGELTFKKIAKKVIGGKRVKGVFEGEICADLDTLPFPSRDLVNKDDYRENQAYVETSRGCPYKCIFCSKPAVPHKVRYHSAKKVVEEMAALCEPWQGRFFFIDDTFTLNRKHVVDICREIIKRKLKVSWVVNSRVDRVDDKLLKLMSQAGCQEVAFGVESGSERIRNEVIGKNIKDKQIIKAVEWCKKNKIRAVFYLMLGFPTETVEDVEKTVQCGLRFKADIIGLHPAAPLPGSKLFAEAIKEGQLEPDIVDQYITGKLGQGFQGVWPIYVPQGLTKDYILKMRRKAYYKFYLRPSFLIRRFFFSLHSWQQLRADIRIFIDLLRHGRTDTSMT